MSRLIKVEGLHRRRGHRRGGHHRGLGAGVSTEGPLFCVTTDQSPGKMHAARALVYRTTVMGKKQDEKTYQYVSTHQSEFVNTGGNVDRQSERATACVRACVCASPVQEGEVRLVSILVPEAS